jgi:hypothetical protein
MTKQETFKRRIRERMTKTGERYGAARRALLTHPAATDPVRRRAWVSHPEASDATILANTGKLWDDWVDAIDAGPGRGAGHTAIATFVREEHGIPGWWAQSVSVGYERIVGLRLPGQMPDGTFSVSRSRIVDLPVDEFRALLLDESSRADLLPGFELTLRSKSASKSLRFEFGRDDQALGVVMFSADPAPGGRLRLTVTHEKLDSLEAGEHWKAFWREWLDAVEVTAGEE